MPRCKHCLLEFPESDAVYDTSAKDTSAKGTSAKDTNPAHTDPAEPVSVFCCHACLAIYRLIRGEGLEGFYDMRDDRSWTPGPFPGAASDARIDVSVFDGVVRQTGDALEADLTIDGIRCASCVWLNEKILKGVPGVSEATVNYATHRARVRFDPTVTSFERVLGRIASIGYTPKPYRMGGAEDELRLRSRDLLMRFGTAAFFSMQLMIYSAALYAGYFDGMAGGLRQTFQFIAMALATPVLFYSGWPFLSASLRGLGRRVINMDVLVTLGAGSAYAYSIYSMYTGGEVYFDTAAMIITFVLLGRYIETGAKGRASEALTRLMSLTPVETLRVGADGAREAVPVAQLRSCDLVEVRPGERVPADGVVERGSTQCDESMLTGESRAVDKSVGDTVYAATVNGLGSFVMRVTAASADTVLMRIVRAVEDAQLRRAPVQALADRVVGWFVPVIIMLAMATLAARLALGSGMEQALINAVSVLVIACPCALGLATPLAIVVATANGASMGALIRGGDVIERVRSVGVVALDKTGTVTKGRPALVRHRGLGKTQDAEALRLMATLERHSEHVVGLAIATAYTGEPLLEAEGFLAHPGSGVSGAIKGVVALGGSREFLLSKGVEVDAGEIQEAARYEGAGQSVVYLAMDGRPAGMFAVSDPVRPEARSVVVALRDMGMELVMLTGDNERTARAVAAEVGIKDVRAGMSPMQKAAAIREIKDEGKGVLMAGDGINDALSLVEATVGVAVGRATDVALESADVVLMRDDLLLLPRAIALSRRAFGVIRQNIFWAFFYNMVAVPLAVAGVLHPIVAAAAMAASSLSVVGNSLRARVR